MVARVTALELRRDIFRNNNIHMRHTIHYNTNQFHSTLIPTHNTTPTHPLILPIRIMPTTLVAAAVVAPLVVVRRTPHRHRL
jgi:hypothetical protein